MSPEVPAAHTHEVRRLGSMGVMKQSQADQDATMSILDDGITASTTGID